MCWLIVSAVGLGAQGVRGDEQHLSAGPDKKPPKLPVELHQHPASPPAAAPHTDSEMQVGVDEQLSRFIDLELMFRDEEGRHLRLGDVITKPTLILPVYFYCPQACSMMLASLASAVNQVPLKLGESYQIIAVSFDADETPAMAEEAKQNYRPIIQMEFPEDQWRFLTGEQREIDRLLQGLGYRLKKTGAHAFVHPNVLVAVSPKGQIIRYLYGIYFLPFDIGMALTEAAKGTPGLSIRRVLTYCFDYDSAKKTYVFRAFRVLAVTIILLLAAFLFFLLRKGNKGRAVSEGRRRRNQG